jgi:HCOMODA/2-hydroxy-3-carboxy-muconic semialdehyde decarboxylase
VIPFGVTRTRLRPIYHMGSFLWPGAPVFDIRKEKTDNDLLIRDIPLGRALAGSLGKCNCVLMRGHGMTVIGDSVPEAVFRAIYTEMNARLQLQAGQLEGPIEFLSDAEGRRSTEANRGTLERPWELWKKRALGRR